MSSLKRSVSQASLSPAPEANKIQKNDDGNESSTPVDDTSNVSAVASGVADVFHDVVGYVIHDSAIFQIHSDLKCLAQIRTSVYG